jgi:pyridoxamine 5'-phosphate oxidase
VSERWIPFDVADADPNPFSQFEKWFKEASVEVREPEAITLVTATSDGQPSVRMVLLRHHDDKSFGWFTNYNSKKGHNLEENPHAALLWYVEPLGRQVRIEGTVKKMSSEASDEYFRSRPRGHQIGAHASNQSHALESRAELEDRVAQLEKDFEGKDIPRPDSWGGYELTPTYFEFWQHRADRLHDRVVYEPSNGHWKRQRLAP